MIFFVLLSYNNLMKLREEWKKESVAETSSNLQHNNNEEDSGRENETGDRIPILNSEQKEIGTAPRADPPKFLIPFNNDDINERGQRFSNPTHWSLTIGNFILIGEYIMRSKAWAVLAEIKGGEVYVTLHDVNRHFTIPWTKGTGCSLALLLEKHPGKVQLMLSHSWAGSFQQTLAAMKTLVTMHFLSPGTLVFFCAFSQYQPEDNAANGLSIKEQLGKEPFKQVIESNPKFGMSVIHTDKSEVYERLWCVDEVFEARIAGINVFALFDPAVWTLENFGRSIAVKTEKAECSNKNDERELRNKINSKDGFAPLDKEIMKFRKRAWNDLGLVLAFRASFGDLKYDEISANEIIEPPEMNPNNNNNI